MFQIFDPAPVSQWLPAWPVLPVTNADALDAPEAALAAAISLSCQRPPAQHRPPTANCSSGDPAHASWQSGTPADELTLASSPRRLATGQLKEQGGPAGTPADHEEAPREGATERRTDRSVFYGCLSVTGPSQQIFGDRAARRA